MNRQQMDQEIIRLADTWTAAELRGDTTFIEKTLTLEVRRYPTTDTRNQSAWTRRG